MTEQDKQVNIAPDISSEIKHIFQKPLFQKCKVTQMSQRKQRHQRHEQNQPDTDTW